MHSLPEKMPVPTNPIINHLSSSKTNMPSHVIHLCHDIYSDYSLAYISSLVPTQAFLKLTVPCDSEISMK